MNTNQPEAFVEIKTLIINGYEIAKIESSKGWGAVKIGQNRGKAFKTKKQAKAFAEAN